MPDEAMSPRVGLVGLVQGFEEPLGKGHRYLSRFLEHEPVGIVVVPRAVQVEEGGNATFSLQRSQYRLG
jgi:hypothetical protein